MVGFTREPQGLLVVLSIGQHHAGSNDPVVLILQHEARKLGAIFCLVDHHQAAALDGDLPKLVAFEWRGGRDEGDGDGLSAEPQRIAGAGLHADFPQPNDVCQ